MLRLILRLYYEEMNEGKISKKDYHSAIEKIALKHQIINKSKK